MKVKIRTLKQDKYEIDIDSSETVSKLKDIIEERHQIAKSWQILIFSGKILENDKRIDSYKIEEKDFLVLMVKKPAEEVAAEKKDAKPVATPSTPSTPSATPASAPTPSATPASAPSPSPSPAPAPAVAAPVSQEQEAAITRICELGFPRDQVEAALRAAFGNADRAVEYLFTGIPEGAFAPPPAQPTGAPAPTQPVAQPAPRPAQPAQGGGGGAGGAGGVFDALRNHPQFPALCQLAQSGGEDALKQILTYFAQTNPDLLQQIAAHQDEFIQLLNTPVPGGAAPPRGGFGGAPGGAGGNPPGVIRVQVTPEDERIINDLVGMGFDRNRVMEAYFLFEKDYTMTANYLLNSGHEDADMGLGGGGGGGFGGGDLYGDDEEDDEEFDEGDYQ